MSDATQGRRPDGPGAYVYRGKHVERIVLVWETYGPVVTYAAAWIADGERRITTTDAMPGDFVPLAKPIAAPDVRWEPVATISVADHEEEPYTDLDYYDNERKAHFDSTGIGHFVLPDNIRLCRAVPVTWSQEPPTVEGAYWVWRPGYKVPDLWRFAEYADGMGMRDYWEVRRNGVRMSMPKSGMGNAGWWYMPAVVPQPPEVTP